MIAIIQEGKERYENKEQTDRKNKFFCSGYCIGNRYYFGTWRKCISWDQRNGIRRLRFKTPAFSFNPLSFLKFAPEFQRHLICFCLFNVKKTCSGNGYTVSVTGNFMIDTKSVDMVSMSFNMLLRLCEFQKLNFKRKLRCNNPQRIDNPLKPLRPYHQQRFLTV